MKTDWHFHSLGVGRLHIMTIKVFLTSSIILHLGILAGHTKALMRPNVRTALLHSDVGITNVYSYIKFESCPATGPLNTSCTGKYPALRAGFGPTIVKDLIGHYQAVSPPDACEEISSTHIPARKYVPYIAIVNRDNCSFEMKVYNAEKAGYRAVIIYASKEDKDLVNMSSSSPSLHVTIPSYSVSHATGTMLAYSSKLVNASRPSMLLIATRKKSFPPNFTGKLGAINANSGEEEDGDNFGEHYFHICIYIWACVVVSSLIGLSVKWGCCGRSLTRWEVTKIPLKRFRRNSASDYQDKCPICHEEFHEGRLIRQLPCNHCYHSYCVDRWLVKMSNRCPLCKQRVSVSLFCSWSKQRDGQGGLQQSDADLDAEEASVVGELPPLPPVQSLTPNTLYGDVIMSGPSKFILMRPGKVTRVIEVPKKEISIQNQNKQCNRHTIDGFQKQHQQHQTHAIVSTPPSGKHSKTPGDSVVTAISSPLQLQSDSNSTDLTKDHVTTCIETLDHNSHPPPPPPHNHNSEHRHFHNTAYKSSRSSSITSEHPLLTEEDHGSIISLHSISDTIVCEEGEERINCVTLTRTSGDTSEDQICSQQETRHLVDKRSIQQVYPNVLTHNRKMESSDSSDYGCNCDFMDDRIGEYKCDVDDNTENHRCTKKVNVNLNPQVFHADVEQHYCRVPHPEMQQEQQLSYKGHSSEKSSCNIEYPRSICSLNVLDDKADTPAISTHVNSCKSCIYFGKDSNNDNGVDASQCSIKVSEDICVNDTSHENSSHRERYHYCEDGYCRRNLSRRACPDNIEGNQIPCYNYALSNHDAGRMDACSDVFNSFFKNSSDNTSPLAAAVPCTGKSTKTVAVELSGINDSYSPSVWQVMATWDGSLRRGLSKTNRKRRYCSGKNVKTL